MSKIYEALLQAERSRQIPSQHQPHTEAQLSRPGPSADAGDTMFGNADPIVESGPKPFDDPSATQVLAVRKATWRPDLKHLPTLEDRGAYTEQFRNLRSRLHEYRGFNKLKSVLVTSGMPKEGKTFVAANLALSLARYKSNKVLLIDGDLRKNSLHKLLGCAQTPGLSSFLASDATALEIMQQSTSCSVSSVSALSVLNAITFIPGGDGGDGAADLSGNPHFAELIHLAEPHFDWIIVDSSPANIVSDAVNLASACDGVLLVARAGVTSYKTAQHAQKQFASANVLGVVLNGAMDVPHQTYYGYGDEPEAAA